MRSPKFFSLLALRGYQKSPNLGLIMFDLRAKDRRA